MERSAFTNLAFEPDPAAMFLNDGCVRQGESLAGTFAHSLGREKWLEYSRSNFLWYSRAGVLDGYLRPLSILFGPNRNFAFGA